MKNVITAKSFLPSLKNIKDVNQHYKFIDLCIALGDFSTLENIVIDICIKYPDGSQDWQYRSVVGHIIHALAFSESFDNSFYSMKFHKLVNENTKKYRLNLTYTISILVLSQKSETIARLLEKIEDAESLGLLLHESIIRKKIDISLPAVQAILERLQTENHPLGFLSLNLFDFEENMKIFLPHYGSSGGSSWNTYSAPTYDTQHASVNIELAEITTSERVQQISTSVRNWQTESNGKVEVRVFHLNGDLASVTQTTLPLLPLECTGKPDFAFHDGVALSEVFSALFSVASTGGAYGSGEGATYGRLRAWQSLAGLVGLSQTATTDEIAGIARNCQWYFLGISTEWFYNVAWDIGIVCVNPSKNEIAVLAATDTD
jgi:hypothetical protein